MRALSIRQPYAELILRGVKTIEYRSRAVGPRLIGERFYIYAAKKRGQVPAFRCQGENCKPDCPCHLSPDSCHLARGVIVGTAEITKCVRAPHNGHYEWHLSNVKRMKKPRKPKGRPQPVWFRPF